MINEAEKYAKEDEEAASRISAKNGLESYAYSLRNSIDGDLKDKISEEDHAAVPKAISETTTWLDASAEASKEEYEEKQKELEGVANPIVRFDCSPFMLFSLLTICDPNRCRRHTALLADPLEAHPAHQEVLPEASPAQGPMSPLSRRSTNRLAHFEAKKGIVSIKGPSSRRCRRLCLYRTFFPRRLPSPSRGFPPLDLSCNFQKHT